MLHDPPHERSIFVSAAITALIPACFVECRADVVDDVSPGFVIEIRRQMKLNAAPSLILLHNLDGSVYAQAFDARGDSEPNEVRL
jgi:hypothetical protein